MTKVCRVLVYSMFLVAPGALPSFLQDRRFEIRMRRRIFESKVDSERSSECNQDQKMIGG
jgi:hypothetical protein